jgi:glycogen synthase
MPLHVAQLGPVPPPEGGVSRNMFAIRERLIADGHRCSVVATAKSTAELSEPDVHYPRSPIELIQTIRSLDTDIVHLHIGGAVTTRVLLMSMAVATFGRGKKVMTMHSGGFPRSDIAKAASRRSLASRVFRRFDHIIAVNSEIDDVFEKFGVAENKHSVILPFSPSKPDPNVALPHDIAEFAAKHSPLLVAVGGLEDVYEPLFQINAMPEIRRHFPNAGLIIVGDGPLRPQVEAAITDAVMLAGNIEHAVTIKLIDAADVMLRTTRFDGDAISVREALHLGTPVVATDTAPRPDGVELIDELHPQKLTDAIKRALDNEIPKASSDTNSSIDEVIDLYDRLL